MHDYDATELRHIKWQNEESAFLRHWQSAQEAIERAHQRRLWAATVVLIVLIFVTFFFFGRYYEPVKSKPETVSPTPTDARR